MHFTLCDLAADIAQNGAESGAAEVVFELVESNRELRFSVRDNGKGMTEAELERAKDPFHTDGKKHPGRRVGLGIPFLIQTAETSGGGWKIDSVKGEGTSVSAWFDLTNIDTPPVGSVPELFRTILLYPGPLEVLLERSYEGEKGHWTYSLRKSELIEALGGLDGAGELILLDRYLRSLDENDE